jgi:hypothetical protein
MLVQTMFPEYGIALLYFVPIESFGHRILSTEEKPMLATRYTG